MRDRQLSICFPIYYQLPIDVTAGWAASLVNTRSPFIQLGGLKQYEWSFLLKETPTTPKWPQLGIKPTIFRLEGRCPDHLAMLAQYTHSPHTHQTHIHTHQTRIHTLYMHARAHTHTHTYTHRRCTYVHTHTHTHMYTHTHTHARTYNTHPHACTYNTHRHLGISTWSSFKVLCLLLSCTMTILYCYYILLHSTHWCFLHENVNAVVMGEEKNNNVHCWETRTGELHRPLKSSESMYTLYVCSCMCIQW